MLTEMFILKKRTVDKVSNVKWKLW